MHSLRTDLHHFSSLWARLDADGDSSVPHAQIISAYGEPGRAYHSLQHLEECLLAFDQAKDTGGMARPDAIEMALWMHDAVYDPKAPDNEEKSAAWAELILSGSGVSQPMIAEVKRLVLVTVTHLAEPGDDSAWMADIDLAILGQDEGRFAEYEEQIREEYSWVQRPIYLCKRAEVLQRFLDRDRLFVTDFFRERLESAARKNLIQAVSRLRRESL